MNKIYIKTDSTNKITYTHYMPFHEKNGLHKTEEELLQDGHLIDSFDDIIPPAGKSTEYYYDGTTLSHQFIDIPPVPEMERAVKLDELQAKLDYLAVMTGNEEVL